MRVLTFIAAAIVAFGALVFLSTQGHVAAAGETMASYKEAMQQISDLNRGKPLQNPQFVHGSRILGWKVIDSQTRVMGDVKDVTFGPGGKVASVNAELNRLRKTSPVYLSQDARNIKGATSQGFVTSFSADEIDAVYPTLLANIPTAAGAASMPALSKLFGLKVRAQDGRSVGTATEILFDSNVVRAEGIVVELSGGVMRGQKVAVPFAAVSYDAGLMGESLSVSTDMADAMLNYAEGN